MGTTRREFLDHLLIFGRRHLEYVLREFIEHYEEAQPHQGLGQRTPRQQARSKPRRPDWYCAGIVWAACFTSSSVRLLEQRIACVERHRQLCGSAWRLERRPELTRPRSQCAYGSDSTGSCLCGSRSPASRGHRWSSWPTTCSWDWRASEPPSLPGRGWRRPAPCPKRPLGDAGRGAICFPALGSPPATGYSYRLILPTKMSVLPKVPAHCAGTLGRGPVPARNASTAAQGVAARASVQMNQACWLSLMSVL